MNTKIKVASGFLLGALLGATTGLILAPRSGRKTRKKIEEESMRMANKLVKRANDTLESAKRTYNRKVDEYAKNGKSSIDQLSDTMSV